LYRTEISAFLLQDGIEGLARCNVANPNPNAERAGCRVPRVADTTSRSQIMLGLLANFTPQFANA
jgi:hypothetical protein